VLLERIRAERQSASESRPRTERQKAHRRVPKRYVVAKRSK
jgi:hypothetical protein